MKFFHEEFDPGSGRGGVLYMGERTATGACAVKVVAAGHVVCHLRVGDNSRKRLLLP